MAGSLGCCRAFISTTATAERAAKLVECSYGISVARRDSLCFIQGQSSDEVRGIGGRDAQEPLRGCAKGGPSKLGGSLRSQVARDIRAGEYGASVDTSHWSELMATLRDWINPPDEWEEKGQSGLRYFLAIREKRIIAGEWLRHI